MRGDARVVVTTKFAGGGVHIQAIARMHVLAEAMFISLRQPLSKWG